MVRMVHMNIFYRIDLEFCDSKSEFPTKTENLGFKKKIMVVDVVAVMPWQ